MCSRIPAFEGVRQNDNAPSRRRVYRKARTCSGAAGARIARRRMIERRPFKSVVELLDQKVTPKQAREFYRKAFVPINLNTGARDEFLLIPGVGSHVGRIHRISAVE